MDVGEEQVADDTADRGDGADDGFRQELQQRGEEIATRIGQLQERRQELAEGRTPGSGLEQASLAQTRAEQAEEHAERAHERAAARHEEAADAHRRAAAELAGAGRPERAEAHHAAAERDDVEAREQQRAATDH